MNYNFRQSIQKAEAKYDLNTGGYYKFQKGLNKIRILAISDEPLASHYNEITKQSVTCIGTDEGCPFHGDNAPKDKDGKLRKPSIRYPMYIIDRASNTIALIFMTYSVIKAIDTLQQSEDYTFESLPMPYDITVNYDPEASPMQMYTVLPSPRRDAIEQNILDDLAKRKSLNDIVVGIKNKQSEKKIVSEVKDEDIPVIEEDKQIDLKDIPF